MKRTSVPAALAVLAMTAAVPIGDTPVVVEEAEEVALTLDVRELIVTLTAERGFDCGDEFFCESGKHVVDDFGELGLYFTHACQSPAVHFGPPCEEQEDVVALGDLLLSSPEAIIEMVTSNPKVSANFALARIETLDCSDRLLASASFAQLGLDPAELTK